MICLTFLFTLGLSVLSGCQPLRRKFTRTKKKSKAKEVQPILEPIDYEAKIKSPVNQYAQHYHLWQVWQRDLARAIENQDNDKRQKYLMRMMMAQLQEMKIWLVDSKKQELNTYITTLSHFDNEFERPVQLRNVTSMKSTLRTTASKIRLNFKPKSLENQFVQGSN